MGSSDFLRPVGTVVLLVAGALLALLGWVLWRGRVGVKALAAGNALMALVVVAWLGAVSGFSPAGTAVVAVTAAGLACLATAQVATLRA